MPRRLKVFQAQFGFYDTVVAAPSQTAALRAWGTHQNLFANGEARVTIDAAAVSAAMAHPGTVLKRPVGSGSAFVRDPVLLRDLSQAPRKAKSAKPATKPEPEPSSKPPADRSRLDAAEAALHKVDETRKAEEVAFRREEDTLDQARADAQAAYVESRKAATAAVVEARKAYREAGGRD